MTSSLGSYPAIFQPRKRVQVRDKSHVNQRIAWKLDTHEGSVIRMTLACQRSREFADGRTGLGDRDVLRNSEDRDRYTRVPVGRIHFQYLAVQRVLSTDLRLDASEIDILTNE